MTNNVGFIGLGKMGKPMAHNLLKAGFSLTVRDIVPQPVEELVERGARAAASPQEVAQASEVVWLMLHAWQVEEVLLGERGVFQGTRPGNVVIDGGNCNPVNSRRYAEIAAHQGVTFLDAGCSGGPEGAREGTMAIMVGGDREAFERCLPIFQAMGRQVGHFGASGNGHLAKVINNLIVGMTALAVSEAVTLAMEAGLDPGQLLEVMSTGAARSWILSKAQELFSQPQGERYQPEFQESTAPRGGGGNQFTWGLQRAHELGLSLPMTSLAHEMRKLGASGGRSQVYRTWAQVLHRYTGAKLTDYFR